MKQGFLSVFALFGMLALQSAAHAEDCPGNPDALGTERTVFLDTSKGFEVGHQFGHDLPLADKEVVLTFDDGPLPLYSEKVRRTLKAECVKATFFLVGRNALTYPDFVRKLASDGHSIGTHTWSHDMYMPQKTLAEGLSQINRGIAAVNVALKTSPEEPQAAPFFRFPGLNSDHPLRDILRDRGIGVFDIDIEGGDWVRGRAPAEVLRRVTNQLQKQHRGIILLHDIQPRTAAMLPEFLKYLKREGYKVVHIEPKPKQDDMTVAGASVPGTAFAASTQTFGPGDLVADKFGPVKRVVAAKSPASSEKLQRMATLSPKQVEPEPQIYAPRRSRMVVRPMPYLRPAQTVSTRYADMRDLPPPVQAMPQRPRPKYLLNELFGIRTN